MSNIDQKILKQKSTKKRKEVNRSINVAKYYERLKELTVSDNLFRETDVLTLKEMAEILQISPLRLRKWVVNHEFKGHIAGNGRIFFLRSDLDKDWLNSDNIFTAHEVAKLLKMSYHSIVNLAKAGKLPGRKYGRSWRFTREDVHDFLDAGLIL